MSWFILDRYHRNVAFKRAKAAREGSAVVLSRLFKVSARSRSINLLQSRIDRHARAFKLDGDLVGRLSGVQHVAELILFPRRPWSRCWFQRAHFPFGL